MKKVEVKIEIKLSKTVIADAWESYKKAVIPKGAGVDQIHDLRIAFYSGAMILQQAIFNGLGTEEEITDGELTMLESIDAELDAFEIEIKAEALEHSRKFH